MPKLSDLKDRERRASAYVSGLQAKIDQTRAALRKQFGEGWEDRMVFARGTELASLKEQLSEAELSLNETRGEVRAAEARMRTPEYQAGLNRLQGLLEKAGKEIAPVDRAIAQLVAAASKLAATAEAVRKQSNELGLEREPWYPLEEVKLNGLIVEAVLRSLRKAGLYTDGMGLPELRWREHEFSFTAQAQLGMDDYLPTAGLPASEPPPPEAA